MYIINYFHLNRFHSNAYWWIISNQYDFIINLPKKVNSIFTFDIKSYYQAIPHFVLHGLMDYLGKIVLAIKKPGFVEFQFNKKSYKF